MSKRILVVEGEEELGSTLGERLRREGYEVEFASDELTGLDKISTSSFDLIILDVMLPGRSGLDLCVAARSEGVTAPILFLTARSRPIDSVIGLKLGGDDCLSKPFDPMELLARVEALLRWPRNGHAKAGPDHVRFDSFTLDLRRGQIVHNGKVINLTTKEFQLLRYLTEHPSTAVSREELLFSVWGHKPGTLTRTVDMHVASLRQKLEHDPKNPQIIETVPHLGYRFAVPVKPAA
jgi:two-component system, OmpR family, alkaline phosphatase synthesis response regulator PhoP